ncbi:MAG TPA: RecQ family zinc-binding domain-containing protein, partial [Flavobacteriales bacterium]|nr:RecQ family zinc-binding domain-containing protein [Flavobacteriales bacterium]
QLRMERARHRLEAMLDYAFREHGCREAAVLRYFGQPSLERCGRCDNCRAMDKAGLVQEPPLRWRLDERIGTAGGTNT